MTENDLPGLLGRRSATVAEEATALVGLLGIDRSVMAAERTKESAYEYLVGRIERHSVFVSRSQRGWMPQSIPKRSQFSGFCVRDRKVPFIFINSRDANDAEEPAGRRILTLTLLAVCIARNRFQVVTYSDRSEELIEHREYEIAEEVLMPAVVVGSLTVESLDDAKMHADAFCVTPSAFAMRAWRLKLIERDAAHRYLGELREEFQARPKAPRRSPGPMTALRRYNSPDYCRALLRHMGAGRIGPSEIRRTLFRNRLPTSAIGEFRAALG